MGKSIVEGEAHADVEINGGTADARDNLAEESRAVVKAAPMGARAVARGEQLVQQVAMAALHIDEVKADLLGQ